MLTILCPVSFLGISGPCCHDPSMRSSVDFNLSYLSPIPPDTTIIFSPVCLSVTKPAACPHLPSFN